MMNGTCGGSLGGADGDGTAATCIPRSPENGSFADRGVRLAKRGPLGPGLAMLIGTAMTLADLIDLEVQLARDRESDRADLLVRDRRLLDADATKSPSRQALLARW